MNKPNTSNIPKTLIQRLNWTHRLYTQIPGKEYTITLNNIC
jgi:hypothetical protein